MSAFILLKCPKHDFLFDFRESQFCPQLANLTTAVFKSLVSKPAVTQPPGN